VCSTEVWPFLVERPAERGQPSRDVARIAQTRCQGDSAATPRGSGRKCQVALRLPLPEADARCVGRARLDGATGMRKPLPGGRYGPMVGVVRSTVRSATGLRSDLASRR